MVFTGIGVFVDLENFGGKVPIRQILDTLLTHGPVLVRRAYGNIQTVDPKNLDALSEEGFEIHHTHPTNNFTLKNSSDIRMVLDVLDCSARSPSLNMITLVSGDSDMLPLVSKLRERNIQVWGFAHRKSCNKLLVKQMDNFEFISGHEEESIPCAEESTPFQQPRNGNGRSSHAKRATLFVDEPPIADVVLDVINELLGKNERVEIGKVLDAVRRRSPDWVKPKGRFKTFLKEIFKQKNLLHYVTDKGYLFDSSR
jgi:uncharacterized LabA/DUF88 family protein